MSQSHTKLTFIADTHYFSKTLAEPGRAYELRSDSDQKCLLETRSIIDAAFSIIAKSDTDAVMIAGDLTNNGEKVSHLEFRKMLDSLKKRKPVYVITATHDWCCDQNPRRFSGDKVYHDVPTLMPEELTEFYFSYGPRQSNDKFITHLGTCSYTVDIGKNVRLLALNDDQNGKGRAGFMEPHFQWIECQIKKAAVDGKTLIGMQHHLLTPNVYSLITGGGVCVGDREYVASRLADAGLKYMVVGHSHLQGISTFISPSGNTITQLNIGSLCGYPAPIVNLTVSDCGIKVETEFVKSFTYNGKTYDANQYLSQKLYALVDRLLESTEKGKTEFVQRLTALQMNGERLAPLYYIAKPLFKAIRTSNVGQIYCLLNVFGIAKSESKRDVTLLAEKPVIDLIHEIALSLFDSSIVKHGKDSAYYKVVTGFFDAIVSVKDCKATRDIRKTIENILLGSENDINSCEI